MKQHNYEQIQHHDQSSLPAIELPKPKIEHSKDVEPIINESEAAKAVERAASTTLPSPIANPSASQTHSPQTTGVAQHAAGGAPVIADDNDLIEKEWVARAKQIVANTKSDPHLQNSEMSKYKATYIKKRFNKELKTEM